MSRVLKKIYTSNFLLAALVSIFIVALDTFIQFWTFSSLNEGDVFVLTPFFQLVQVWNTGISFGVFKNLAYGSTILSLFSLGICIGVFKLLLNTSDRTQVLAYALIIGGGLGNILDRVIYGAVADYLDFHLFDYHWPAFNITDSAVFMGVVILIWTSMVSFRNGEKR